MREKRGRCFDRSYRPGFLTLGQRTVDRSDVSSSTCSEANFYVRFPSFHRMFLVFNDNLKEGNFCKTERSLVPSSRFDWLTNLAMDTRNEYFFFKIIPHVWLVNRKCRVVRWNVRAVRFSDSISYSENGLVSCCLLNCSRDKSHRCKNPVKGAKCRRKKGRREER